MKCILGVDPGLNNTALALINPDLMSLIAYTEIKPSVKLSKWNKIGVLQNGIVDFFLRNEAFTITEVGIEGIIFNMSRFNPQTLISLIEARTAIILQIYTCCGLWPCEVPVKTVGEVIGVRGRNRDTKKEETEQAVKMLFPVLKDMKISEHVADAIAVALAVPVLRFESLEEAKRG